MVVEPFERLADPGGAEFFVTRYRTAGWTVVRKAPRGSSKLSIAVLASLGSRMKCRYLAGCVLTGMLALSRTGVACDCVWSSLSARVERADVVLLAKVRGQKSSEFVELQPAEIFKGKITATFTVKTGDSNCSVFHSSVSPKAGERYLLFLEKSKDSFVTGLCDGSGHFEWKRIQAELPELRRLYRLRTKQSLHRTSATPARAVSFASSAKETSAP